jgi:hypothetical protein
MYMLQTWHCGAVVPKSLTHALMVITSWPDYIAHAALLDVAFDGAGCAVQV